MKKLSAKLLTKQDEAFEPQLHFEVGTQER